MAGRLQCYAIGDDHGWEAICVDLDIAVDGKSFEEVFSNLQAAIEDHIGSALAEDDPVNRVRLLMRRAPWYVRAKYAGQFLCHWLFGSRRDRGDTHGFTVHCHA